MIGGLVVVLDGLVEGAGQQGLVMGVAVTGSDCGVATSCLSISRTSSIF